MAAGDLFEALDRPDLVGDRCADEATPYEEW